MNKIMTYLLATMTMLALLFVPNDPAMAQSVTSINGPTTGAPGDQLTWTATTSGGNKTKWLVNNSEQQFGSSNTFSWTFNSAGSYQICAQRCQGNSCSNSVCINVTISAANTPPVAQGTAPSTGTTSESLTFNGSSSYDPDGDAITYLWDFGDGATSTSATASHSYFTANTYSVTLTVTDPSGASDTANFSVNITSAVTTQPPTAIIGGNSSGVVGESLTFDGLSSLDNDESGASIVSYSWTTSDGGSGSGNVFSHTFSAVGNYTITLTVTDNEGEQDTATMGVNITDQPNEEPIARIIASSPATVGQAVNFDGTTSADPDGSIVSYQWDFGDGSTITGALPSHTYNTAGNYTVRLTVTDDDGATNATTMAMVVEDSAEPLVADPGGPYTVNVGTALTFSSAGSTGNIVSYFWDFGDGGTSSEANPSYTYASPTTYTVTLTVSDGTNTDTATTEVIAQESALGGECEGENCLPRFSENVFTFCVGDNVRMFYYIWREPGGNDDVPSDIYFGGWNAAGWNNGQEALVEFGLEDVGNHSVELYFNGNEPDQLMDTAVIQVLNGGQDCGGVIDQTTGDVDPDENSAGVYNNQEVCGPQHACDFGLVPTTPGPGNQINDPCEDNRTRNWDGSVIDVSYWQGDEDGDGLADCADPDCFGYGEGYPHQNNGPEIWHSYYDSPSYTYGCPYYPGFASFYDDQEDKWLALTSINLKNFLADTLVAEFPKGEYLPSGVPIPPELQFPNSQAVYVQQVTGITGDLVDNWVSDTLSTSPWVSGGGCYDCDTGDQIRSWTVCADCDGDGVRETTLTISGDTYADAVDDATRGGHAPCRGGDLPAENDLGPCVETDVVLIPVIDVLRDPPPGFDPYTVWITERRHDFFNSTEVGVNPATQANIVRGGHADGTSYTSNIGAADTYLPGIRLYNADSLRTWMNDIASANTDINRANFGVTFTSNVPIYVQGDFNTDGGNHALRLRTAIMADGTVVLSNDWRDDESNAGYAVRVAAETAQNFAVLSGNRTVGSNVEPIERLIRYREDWSNVRHTFRTSLVNLFRSQYGTATFVNGTWSSDPVRDWNFDTRFLSPLSLPPGTPRVTLDQSLDWQFDRSKNW